MENKGFAYIDEYCFEHVVDDIETAKKNSLDGCVYLYEGEFSGGYATLNGERARLGLPGSVDYGNAPTGGTPMIPDAVFTLIED